MFEINKKLAHWIWKIFRFHLIQVLQHNNEVERKKNSVKHNAGKKLPAQSSESTGNNLDDLPLQA